VEKSEHTTTAWELLTQSTVSAAEIEDDMFTPTADTAVRSDITRILPVMCMLEIVRDTYLYFETTPS